MRYETHIFDCDGVLLQTNTFKSAAFYAAALPYGEDAATQMVEYHKRAGSATREERWHYFFQHIVNVGYDYTQQFEQAMNECSQHIQASASAAELVPGVEAYLKKLCAQGCDLYVVSGVATYELRNILAEHGIDHYFKLIEGGPPHKEEVLRSVVGDVRAPAVYYGDTFDDYECAKAAGLDFVFVSHCTEMEGWQFYFEGSAARLVDSFVGLEHGDKRKIKARVDRDGWADVDGEMINVGTRLAGAEVTFER